MIHPFFTTVLLGAFTLPLTSCGLLMSGIMSLPSARVGFAANTPVKSPEEVIHDNAGLKGDIVQIFGRITEHADDQLVVDGLIAFKVHKDDAAQPYPKLGEKVVVRGVLNQSRLNHANPRWRLDHAYCNPYNYRGHETEIAKIDPHWKPRSEDFQ
jgi:hypothetical protein